MEDKVHRLVGSGALLLLDELLGVGQNLRGKLDVTRRVDAVDVTEGGSDGVEVRSDRLERLVDLVNLFRLGVQVLRGDVRVIHAILFAAGDADFHFEEAVDLLHASQVLFADFEVLLNRFLGQVEHVGREERFTVLGEIFLVRLQEPVKPRKKVLGAVVRVQDHRHAVHFRQRAHLKRTRDATGDRRLLVLVIEPLTRHEVSTTVGKLNNHRRVGLLRRLEAGVDHRGHRAVHRRNRVSVFPRVVKHINHILTRDDTLLERRRRLRRRARHRRRSADRRRGLLGHRRRRSRRRRVLHRHRLLHRDDIRTLLKCG